MNLMFKARLPKSSVELSRHLDHCSSKARTFEHRLGDMVLLGGEEQHPGSAELSKRSEGGVHQCAADPLPPLGRVDDKIVDDSRRTAQCHVIVPLHPRIAIADDFA